MIKSNFHTHSQFCDGRNTAEEMVETAIEKGFHILGFSSHSYTEMDKDFALNPNRVADYCAEITRLREKYEGQIKIYCGIEQDYFSKEPTDQYDYVIGSVHYVLKDGEYVCVDHTADILKDAVERLYGGDFDALAEDYFALEADIVNKTNADIIGHFDLISKFNEKTGYTQSRRFLAAAEKAVKKLVPLGKPFEINTGGMARAKRKVPYPSPEILKLIKKYGGKVILSSDCHDKQNLDFAFDYANELVKEIGFSEIYTIIDGEMKSIKL